MTLDEREDHFWDVLNNQMSERVSAHIAKHRDVEAPVAYADFGLDSWHEKERQLADSGAYRDQVSFSAYADDWSDNLDEVAVEGRIMIKSPKQDFFGGMSAEHRKDYVSEILTNPTWLDLCLCANDMINCGGDNHHIFLEDVHRTGSFTLDDKSFILLYDFSMGS